MSLAIVDTEWASSFSYPAQRSDGYNPRNVRNAIPEGMRFRLDPSVDVDALRIHPLAKMIARAAQQYGFIVSDKAGAVSVIAESGAAVKAATGIDPWGDRDPATGRLPLLGGAQPYSIMVGFPWNRMQALPMDYGKP